MFPNFFPNQSVPSSIYSNKYLKIGFSQNGEDDYIRDIFWVRILDGFKGTYLDIGCYDESAYSNTKILNLLGWSGYAVDGDPCRIEPWIRARKDDKFLNVMIKDSEIQDCQSLKGDSLNNFYMFEASALNTSNKARAFDLVNKGMKLDKVIQIESLTILQLAKRILANTPSFKPDIVSIDLEQTNILPDLPEFLTMLKFPELICLEWISEGYSLNNYQSSPEFEIFNSVGYEIKALIGGNIFAYKI